MKYQNLSFHLKQLAATLAVSFVLVGCGADKKDVTNASSTDDFTNSQSSSIATNSTNDNMPASSTIIQNELSSSEEEHLPSEAEEFDYFNSAKEEIQDLLESEQIEEAKEKGKEYFITGIDFVFYDKEIKGITFDDLTEEGKKVTLENLEIMDGWIDAVAPDYKDKIGEKYAIVKDFISTKYYDAIDTIKESIGEENYSSFQNQKEKLTDKLSDTKDKTLEKISNWYQNFKNNKS